MRDQLWAMVASRHEHLRQAGAVVFGLKDLDANVPPLGARVASTSKGASEKANGQAATTTQPEGGTA